MDDTTTTDLIQQTVSFKKMLSLGKLAEQKFLEWIKPKMPDDWVLWDTSGMPAFQKVDVDFVIQKNPKLAFSFEAVFTGTTDDFVCVEIKYDGSAERTGNLAFELYNKGKIGWGLVTRADVVFLFTADVDYKSNTVKKWHRMFRINMKRWRNRLFSAQGQGIVLNPTKPRMEYSGKWFVDHLDRIETLKECGVIDREFPVDW